MAKAELTVTIRVRDIDRMRLLAWELRMLADEMRVMASPHAERLERIVGRFLDGGDDEHGDEPEDVL
jgi:hypothetical protein